MSPVMEGVKIGPLDPDKAESFGSVGIQNSARQLIRLHAQAFPPEFVRVFSLSLDEERTKGLDREEVADYLDGLTLDNGDPAMPEGCEVVGAAVHGERDRDQYLTYVYSTPSGRTAKWFAPYTEEDLPNSFAEGSDRVHLSELRKKGIAITGDMLGNAERETKGVGELRVLRQKLANAEEQLRQERASRGDDEGLPVEQSADADADADTDADTDAQGAEAAEGEQDGEQDGASVEQPAAAQEPPFEGYDEEKAADVVRRIKDEDTSDEEIQAILDYEKTHHNRATVVAAADQTLGTRGSAD